MTAIVPPLAVFLAKDPLVLKHNLTSLNEVWCGAAPLSADIQKAISERCVPYHMPVCVFVPLHILPIYS